jgi:hypothetical protein
MKKITEPAFSELSSAPDEPPPFFGEWKRIYLFVLLYLFILIAILYAITLSFRY